MSYSVTWNGTQSISSDFNFLIDPQKYAIFNGTCRHFWLDIVSFKTATWSILRKGSFSILCWKSREPFQVYCWCMCSWLILSRRGMYAIPLSAIFFCFLCEDILMAGVTVWISFSTWIRFESFSKYIFCSLLLLLHFEGSIVFLHQCLQQHIKHTFQFFNLVAPSFPISTSVLTLYRLNATYSDQTEMDSIVIYFNLFACIIGWVHYSPSSISITRNGARISNESHVPAPVMKFLGKISLTFHLFPFRNDRDNRQTNHTARVFH